MKDSSSREEDSFAAPSGSGSRQAADRNLLFGILALQNNLIDRRELVRAFDDWVADKLRPLDQLLVEAKAITPEERDLMNALVDRHLARHGGDPQQSLAALSSLGALREDLSQIAQADADVQASLAAVARPGGPQTPVNLDATWPAAEASPVNPRFRILHPHAKGGVGEVYVAEDSELNRQVALKQIQIHYADRPDARARLKLEGEITGGLEHPGIVPVYGLGTYANGRQFYAMRLIRGDNLQEAVDRFHKPDSKSDRKECPSFSSLDFRKLLGRFIDVCDAMSYAHSRGVLHRDLKPGNIMLGKYGETLVVDWGLAKPLQRRAKPEEPALQDEHTLYPASGSGSAPTLAGVPFGTPAYMSPEQAAGRLDQLGPASDIYSLGATLYYLLTGQAPFGNDNVETTLRRVREGDFAPPRNINAAVPGALEAICLKAMSVEAGRRYRSPQDLADDLEHWLADEPIAVHREPAAARARRWFRKHPRSVAALTAAVVVGLAGLATVAAVQSRNNRLLTAAYTAERTAKQEAEEKRIAAEQAEQAADSARKEEAQARQHAEIVTDYLVRTFRSPDPERDGRNITIVETLDRALQELELVEEQRTKVRLLDAFAETYGGLGLYRESIPPLEQIRDLCQSLFGAEHAVTLAAMNNLAEALQLAGHFPEAIELHQKTLELRRATLGLGPHHRDTLTSLSNLALAHKAAGRLDIALRLNLEARELRRDHLGEADEDLLTSMNNLAAALESTDPKEAIALYEETLAVRKTQLSPGHPDLLTSMSNLAQAHVSARNFDVAVPMLKETLDLRQAKLGPDHPDTLTSASNLARAHFFQREYALALPLQLDTLQRRQARLGPGHSSTLTSLNNLAKTYQALGKIKEAVPLYEESLQQRRALWGSKHPETLTAINNLASAYRAAREFKLALPLAEEALKLRTEKLGEKHGDTLASRDTLAQVYKSAGDLKQAAKLLEETLELRRAKVPSNEAELVPSLNTLAATYYEAKKFEQAIPLFEEVLRILRAQGDSARADMVSILTGLAATLKAANNLPRALATYEEARLVATAVLREDDPRTLNLLNNLAMAHLASDHPEHSLPVWESYVAAQRRRLAADEKGLAAVLMMVGSRLLKPELFVPATTYLSECVAIRERILPDDWSLFHAQSMWGAALMGQKNLSQAEPLLTEGYQGLKQRQQALPAASRRASLQEALDRLIRLHEATNNAEQLKKWKAELATLPPASASAPQK